MINIGTLYTLTDAFHAAKRDDPKTTGPEETSLHSNLARERKRCAPAVVTNYLSDPEALTRSCNHSFSFFFRFVSFGLWGAEDMARCSPSHEAKGETTQQPVWGAYSGDQKMS